MAETYIIHVRSPCLWQVCMCFPPLHTMPAVQRVSVQHPAEEEARVHPSDSATLTLQNDAETQARGGEAAQEATRA